MVGTAGCGKKNNDDDNENNITTYNNISPEKLHLDKCYKKIIKNGEAVKVYNSSCIDYLIDKDTYEVSVYLFYFKKSYGDIVSTCEIYTLPGEEVIYSNSFQTLSNGLMLTNYEIDILTQYEIPYLDCKSLEELINRIETTILEFDDCEELESISMELASRNYYLNTNK